MNSADRLAHLLVDAIEGREELAREALAPLLEYDARHDADLVRTLAAYLKHGCNATRCAQSLFLHRSGLLYRLGRIEDLLGVHLDNYETRVALEVATLVLEID